MSLSLASIRVASSLTVSAIDTSASGRNQKRVVSCAQICQTIGPMTPLGHSSEEIDADCWNFSTITIPQARIKSANLAWTSSTTLLDDTIARVGTYAARSSHCSRRLLVCSAETSSARAGTPSHTEKTSEQACSGTRSFWDCTATLHRVQRAGGRTRVADQSAPRAAAPTSGC